jgi:miniconductance mechanosensitive channel
MMELLHVWLEDMLKLGDPAASILTALVACVALLMLAFLADLFARRVLLKIVTRLITNSKNDWDDLFLEHRVFNRLAHLAPAIVVFLLIESALPDTPALASIVQRLALIYMLFVALLVTDSFLNSLHALYKRFELSRSVPINGFVQVAKIAVNCLGLLVIVSVAVDKNPGFFLGGIGAMTAVLMLIFRDPILGFVAGIQLTANKMVKVGDWISMPKYGADGDVLDVGLTTVKVQNWDKTITAIPTYALISDSFKNWQGMTDSGGRRIKRAISIDMRSVKFCDEELLEKLGGIRLLADYLSAKKSELTETNRAEGLEEETTSNVNARRLTNLGTFRAYLEQYLKHHPKIHQEMTFLVRQLPPSQHGIGMEVYVFSNDQDWANYEAIQCDIFDHILAVLPEFELRVFQTPTGADLAALGVLE